MKRLDAFAEAVQVARRAVEEAARAEGRPAWVGGSYTFHVDNGGKVRKVEIRQIIPTE